MPLSFEPLAWIYHDGWNFKQSYSIPITSKKVKDMSVTFYQKGHCHLFIPGFDTSEHASSLAYSGTQLYQFGIVDEWGPNANNPNVNQSVSLKGKPIWYFYIQEYWRRMYIQPWDKIDETCELPLNQSITYDKYSYNQFISNLITNIDDYLLKIMQEEKTKEYYLIQNYSGVTYDSDWYSFGNSYDQKTVYLFFEYLNVKRRSVARKQWLKINKLNFKQQLREFYWGDNKDYDKYFEDIENQISDYQIRDFILKKRIRQDNTYYDYKQMFEQFYKNKADEYNGWCNKIDIMNEHLKHVCSENAFDDYKEILKQKLFKQLEILKDEKYKIDINNNIYIPQEKTTGHIGIKYDASYEKHSLGPFQEGRESYFFNTVVNRTMPAEYWLDSQRKTRQYYLKQKNEETEDTSGGATWKNEGNNEHFLWYENTFKETNNQVSFKENNQIKYKTLKGQAGWGEYYLNNDKDTCDPVYMHGEYWNRRRKDDDHKCEGLYHQMPQNAKRLRTDKYLYLKDPEIGPNSEDFGWVGRNDKVVLVQDNGEKLQWQPALRGWTGWYEYGEIIQCVKDNQWYKRVWKPQQYKIENPYENQYPTKKSYGNYNQFPFTIDNPYENNNKHSYKDYVKYMNPDITQDNNYPHWSRKKRQSFPNPPPWLSNPKCILNKTCLFTYDSLVEQVNQEKIYFTDRLNQWIKNPVYDNPQENKLHMLHWEYCHYFNLLKEISNSSSFSSVNNVWKFSSVPSYDYNNNFIGYKDEYYSIDVSDEEWWNKMDKNINTEYYNKTYRETYESYATYEKTMICCFWESAITKFVIENEKLPDINEENEIFENYIKNLPKQQITITSGSLYEPEYYEMPVSPELYKDYYRLFTIIDGSTGYEPQLQILEISEADILLSNKAKNDKIILINAIKKECNNTLIDQDSIPENILNSATILNNSSQVLSLKANYSTTLDITIKNLLARINEKIIIREVKKYYWVNEDDRGSINNHGSNYQGSYDPSLSYISFEEFCHVWQPLSDKQKQSLDLQGDMPNRNATPYPPITDIDPALLKDMINFIYTVGEEEIVKRINLSPDNSNNDGIYKDIIEYKDNNNYNSLLRKIREIVIDVFEKAWGLDEKNEEDKNYIWVGGEKEFKYKTIVLAIAKSLDDCPYLSMFMPFSPKIDEIIRAENAARAQSIDIPLPPFKISKLDEIQKVQFSLQPVDPFYDKNKPSEPINPIEVWKTYFNKREIYTIPHSNVVDGDKATSALVTSYGQILQQGDEEKKEEPTLQVLSVYPMHPRSASYTHEDGARRLYSDQKFISPIIEYQKIIRLNWQRLPKYQQQEQKYKFEPFKSEKTVNALWRLDESCNWGDGFSTQVKIPYTIDNKIKSPFSLDGDKTLPIGEYVNDCVPPENQMRYHIEWYDSLEKIRLYDYPNYVKLIHAFQQKYMPADKKQKSQFKDNSVWEYYSQSYYKEDFNSIEKTKQFRESKFSLGNSSSSTENFLQNNTTTWQDKLNEYWTEINTEHKFENNPIVKNRNCYGEQIVENIFEQVDGKLMWREQQTHLLPSIDKVAYIDQETLGYYDSKGNIIKGGNVVKFHNPTGVEDGKWVEQCLGAIVKAKCVQIMEDRLGYRYQVITEDTAMSPNDSIKGEDYKG